jgi:hypothetical protein
MKRTPTKNITLKKCIAVGKRVAHDDPRETMIMQVMESPYSLTFETKHEGGK